MSAPPVSPYRSPLSELDVLITPLVAFDEQGQRLGMGGGFYDRTLQNWQQYGLQ
ncbi:5-formyltetrahydrofolate cyclo-ligase, partial [Enterobacter hormaechei]|uniref:5-formyltetrahydrofolate cyclo-ligase n=1 Tax=Enterobacter hormaechei TaxID=158836 RepID=UPI0025A06CDB